MFLPGHMVCRILLASMNVKGSSRNIDRERYAWFKKNVTKGMIVYNDSSHLGPFVLMKELHDLLTFYGLDKHANHCVKAVAPLVTRILNIENVRNTLNARDYTDGVIAMPSCRVGEVVRHGGLQPFQHLAFETLPKVLPVLIRYYPVDPRIHTCTIWQMLRICLWSEENYYIVRVLEPLYPFGYETPANFSARCHRVMQEAFEEMCKQEIVDARMFEGVHTVGFLIGNLFLIAASIFIQKKIIYYGVCFMYLVKVLGK